MNGKTRPKSISLPDPLVAIQVNSASFADEGVDPVLDNLQRLAGVNALYLVAMSWARGTGGRQQPKLPLPDHGVQQYDLDWQGGLDVRRNDNHYRDTSVEPPNRSVEYGEDWDVFAQVIPKARERNMAVFAMIAESVKSDRIYQTPGFWRTLEIDAWGRPTRVPCYRNPNYVSWYAQIIEDWAHNAPVDGIVFAPERPGPLNILMESPSDPNDIDVHGPFGGAISCFCPHCCDAAERKGINAVRAQQGYRELIEWNRTVSNGIIPEDGGFVTFWRLLLEYPEILAWQRLWTDGAEQFMKMIYGVAKAVRPDFQVGWHLYHNYSLSPFCRASSDYARWAEFSDFLKPVVYNATGGARMNAWVKRSCKALFADSTPETIYPFLLDMMGYKEGALKDLINGGLSADYVEREVRRAVNGVAGACAIDAGVDVDIPNNFGVEEANRTTREQVRDAVKAALRGGARGVVLSRKYSEMTLDNLAGAGDALAELGLK